MQQQLKLNGDLLLQGHWEKEDAAVGWLKCCFTSTETVALLGTGAQDGHLDFHTAPELCEDAAVCEFLLLNVHGGEKSY